MGSGDLPLGVVDNMAYSEQVAPGLRPGQILFIGTDGVWEMPDTKGEQYGKERLREVIRPCAARSADEIVRSVRERLTAFRGDVKSVDDLCLDEYNGVAYLARHPDHIVERVPLDPTTARLGRAALVGEPFNEKVIGPTSIDWGHGPNDYGRVAFVTTDGGTVERAPDGVLRPAQLVRIDLAE